MSNLPNLESVSSDPLIASDCSVFSPSPSRSWRPPPPRDFSTSVQPDSQRVPDEQQPLLGTAHVPKKPFYRARPLWLVPFAIVASLVRGMTLAPRVEVFTQLSCNALHENYNHTTIQSFFLPGLSSPPPPSHDPYTPIYFSLDPSGPHFTPVTTNVSISTYADSDDEGEEDPRRLPSPHCLSDPAVQAGAARLQTTMTTTMGLLSALTTGWWGHFGERHGRTKVLAIATLGLFLTDLTFILVSTPNFPLSGHSHKFLLVAPIIEGLLGGWSTLQSATSAYVSDCTSSGSRARIFSRFSGVLYLGFSIGPAFGGWLISHPISLPFINTKPGVSGQTVTSVFWVAICCSFMNLLLVTFVFPESLSKEKRDRAMMVYRGAEKGKIRAEDVVEDEQLTFDEVGAGVTTEEVDAVNEAHRDATPVRAHKGGIIRGFLSPLAVFLPTTVVTSSGRKRNDWSLTLLAGALFGYMLSTGVFQLKYLYAVHVYGWGAQQLSYFISFLGGGRAVHLLFILPFIIATFKPKHDPNPTNAHPNPGPLKSKSKAPKPTKSHLASDIHFDLILTRFSLVVDILSNAFIVCAPSPVYKVHALLSSTSPSPSTATTQDFSMPPSAGATHSQLLFVMASSLSTVGAGVVPAIQSLALCLMQYRALDSADITGGPVEEVDVGRLFGALAVLQAVGQMILGPMLFGLIYSGTVATFPKTIFMTSAGILVMALALVCLIRSPVAPGGSMSAKGKGKAKDVKRRISKDEVEVERGRSRVSKDLQRRAMVYGSVQAQAGAGPSGSA